MSKKHKDSLIWGIVLVVLGGLFLLQNAGIDIWEIVLKLWPLILIIWGGFKLYYGIKARNESKNQPEIIPEDRKDES
ncbi:MAG: LiaF transmembrane domain-containing protein [Candidatus Saccharicenans sp.]|nr:MAG: hypothetical protein C0168_09840 [Candidatus Aminicenantes bacterium]HEK84904.1 hypothetical protein [Candidatus Aminicenantes bacterium]